MVEKRYYRAEEQFWINNISKYYCDNRCIDNVFKSVKKDFNIIIKSIVQLKKVKEYDKKIDKWRSITEDFGEIVSSWYFENNYDVIFLKLRWIEHPLKTSQGVDLVGLNKNSFKIYYGEAKLRNSNDKNQIKSKLNELAEQITYRRLDKIINDPLSSFGSFKWISQIIKKLIIEGKLSKDYEVINKILDDKEYIRCGVILRPDNKDNLDFQEQENKLKDEHSKLAKKRQWNKVIFVDFTFDNLKLEIESFIQNLESG